MRLSSLVSLLVVTASFALGGCAADADQTSSEAAGQGESALVGSARAHQTFESKTPAAALAAEAARTRTVKITGEAVAVGRTGMIVGQGASPAFTETAEMEEGLVSGLDTAPRADLNVDIGINPIELVQVDPAFGARLPSNQQLSGSGSAEAYQETAASTAHREP
jgi:hypothetical protein